MRNQLIVTAVDFGLCSSVNEGIIYAINHPGSFITELSLLPNAPGSTEAAAYVRKNKDISVNLCINLTTFKPLSKNAKSLVGEDGNFLPVDVWTWDFSNLEKFDQVDVEEEIREQYNWFVKNVGRKPSAIVSRKNEHGDPKILIPFASLAKSESIPIRTPVWRWKENYGAQSYVEAENIPSTSSIKVGMFDWKGENGYNLEQDLDKLIEDTSSKQGVSELLVYVGFVDEELFGLSTVSWQRAQFFNILNNAKIESMIKNTFTLIKYQDLKKVIKAKKYPINIEEVNISPASPKDFARMVEIQSNDGFRHAYGLTEERLSKLFERGESFVIAKHKGKTIGFASVDTEVRARLHFICVDIEYAGARVGSLLMNELLKIAKNKNHKRAHTYVEYKSSKEIFLQKIGFMEIGSYKDRYGPGKDASIWEISLKDD